MSIIHEALKKVQSNRSQSKAPRSEIPTEDHTTQIFAEDGLLSRDKDDVIVPAPEPRSTERKPAKRTADPLPRPVAANTSVTAQKKAFPLDIFLWSLLIAALGGFAFFNLQEFTARIAVDRPAPAAVIPATPSETPAIAAPPVAAVAPAKAVPDVPKRQKGEVVLYGITVMDGKQFALINDGIYEVGDIVDGAEVTRITAQSVVVNQKGKTKILKVLNRHIATDN